jgi:Ca2+-binding EF-hand superfamily protein
MMNVSDAKSNTGTNDDGSVFNAAAGGSRHRADRQRMKTTQQTINDAVGELKAGVSHEFFIKLCGDADRTGWSQARFTKDNLLTFLTKHFGSQMAAKLVMIFDWSTKEKDLAKFREELGMLLENHEMMMEIAFDLYDCNRDGEVSQLDLIKLLKIFDEGPATDKFEKVVFKDISQLARRLIAHEKLRYLEDLAANADDELFLKRYLNTRNLQHLDRNYLKLKEKILWPLYEFQKPGAIDNKSTRRGVGGKKAPMTSDANRTGRVPRLFKKLQSVKEVKNRRPLLKGHPHGAHICNGSDRGSEDDDEELDSEEEKERNKPFFETMEYWKFKQEQRESVAKGKRIQPTDKKEKKPKAIGNNLHQNY